MIQVFEQEIHDGLADLMSCNSIAYTMDIVVPSQQIIYDSIAEMIAKANREPQTDSTLFYMESILATVGWNLNDDVFLRDETFAARFTPVDKPFNMMHNQDINIGHMTSSRLLDSDYKEVSGPDFEHIAVSSVIYRAYRDKDKKAEIEQTIAEIEAGKWKVSMECVFPKFDYAMINAEGKQIIIPRTAETSYLTKHLRRYKGDGTYKGNRIGRVLRDINFCGKGLVDRPGNPFSIIFNNSQKFLGATASLNEIKELVKMNEFEKAELESAKASVTKLTSELETFKAQAAKEAADKLNEAIAQRDALIAEQKTAMANLQADLAKISTTASTATAALEVEKADKVAIAAKLETAEAALNTIKAEKILTTRKAALKDAGVSAERAEALIVQFASASDEMFNTLVSTVAEFKPFVKKDDEKKEDKKDNEKKEDAKAEVKEDAKADLDNAELSSEAALNVTGKDKAEGDGKAISEYLLKNAFTAGKTAKRTKGE